MPIMNRAALQLLTPPQGSVLSLAAARLHLRLDAEGNPPVHRDDALVEQLIAAATARFDGADGLLGRCLLPQQWRLTLDAFPIGTPRDDGGTIILPLAPVISVDAVSYIDSAGAAQSLDAEDWYLRPGAPARLYPAPDSAWPATQGRAGAVTVDFTAGYQDNASPPQPNVPAPLVAAIKLLVGHLYENRQAVIVGTSAPVELPLAVEALTAPYRVYLP